MVAKVGTLNGPDSIDVVMVILAFEAMNNCRLAVRIGRVDDGLESVLSIEGEAWPTAAEGMEASCLALVKTKWGSDGPRTMEAAILQLIYKLDFALAEVEWDKAQSKKA